MLTEDLLFLDNNQLVFSLCGAEFAEQFKIDFLIDINQLFGSIFMWRIF